MERDVYQDEHSDFAESVAAFLRQTVTPRIGEFEKAGMIDRDVYRAAGELGIVGLQIPEEFGGGGQDGFLFNCVVTEQVAYERSTMGSLRVHTDVVTPYVLSLATSDQRQRWLPGMANGELMTSIAMTEPGAGSDLAGIRTSLDRRGSDWVLNGSKTFITGGAQSDLVIVVARSEAAENRRHGLTLAVVEASTPGFSRGAPLEKLGLKAQDTTELFFDDVVVPADNILGEPGRAFTYLSSHLAQERLSIAVNSQAQALAALAVTCEYVRDRKVFGTTLGTFQNTKFVLADLATRVSAGQALVDRAMGRHERGRLDPAEAAKVKLFCTELHGAVVDACLQLHGGYGYTWEQDICRMYADARVARIYGGTSEVMKGIVARTLNLVDR
ncbi:acyl-CoA dehydrogenase family protein (plasmid) [Rhodococcus ruber]|uniref:acyl-CoA dehydrogenase family protein n=1 Tax=Rhodococcus TaxID=1827 RepID=UPI0007DA1D54|nr:MULTISPECIES: acyl-CoA dehydrogenase family protein [Rhodococcus]MCT7293636.1 acyl-CoA dehydrogenase family protein [Rhodococcus sp. PAE-6]QXU56532.1 acyl-CoA dehydrogenase family protein [Rhodococcus sp. LW-XY12]UQB75899.1 acyl-CoA dehydrogenase family protein [Rhodococcus ruber]